MMRAALTAVCFLFVLGGCMGKPGPAEQYLRVLGPEPECARVPGGAGRLPVLAVRGFKTLDALDRQGVMVAEGKVMQASQRLYWEATPGKLVEQAVVRAASCQGGLVPAWPVRSTTEAALWLSGLVSDFSVQAREMRLSVAVECQLWDSSGGVALSGRTFRAQVPLAGLEGAAIADAGEKALADVSAQIALWARETVPAGLAKGGR